MAQLPTHECPHCQAIMISDYRICPLCKNDYPQWQHQQYQLAREALSRARDEDKDESADSSEARAALVSFLINGIETGVECARCRKVKRPEDECCFDQDGHMLPETTMDLPEPSRKRQMIAANEKRRRTRMGLTQSEYADRCGIPLRRLRLIENGYTETMLKSLRQQ